MQNDGLLWTEMPGHNVQLVSVDVSVKREIF
jgi:hypothetical protein